MTDKKHPHDGRASHAPGTFAARLHTIMTRLSLTDKRAARYLGVPHNTLRKWATGERQPCAAAIRLVDVLGVIETMAPLIHESLVNMGDVNHARPE